MRMMMKVAVSTEAGSRAIKDGRMEKTLGRLMEQTRPEATWFYTEHGRRTMMFVFDMKEPSMMPPIAEPLFAELDAMIELHPVMNLDELKKGLEQVGRGR